MNASFRLIGLSLVAGIATLCSASTARVIEINSGEEFQNVVLNNTKPVLVDFYASWCNPCKRMAPDFARIAAEYTDIVFVKVNVEKFKSIADRYGVRSFPTLISFFNGAVKFKTTGSKNAAQLRDMALQLRTASQS